MIYLLSTLHCLIIYYQKNLTEFSEKKNNKEGSFCLACNKKHVFFTLEQPKRYNLGSCQKVCDALHYLLDNLFIKILF